jgi:F0F1-type ATP synthase assembly protein I
LKGQGGKGDGGGFGRRGAKAYQAALEAVFAIPVAGGLGYWADAHFGTSPLLLLVGLVLGFASFVMRIVRMRKLVEDPEASNSDREEREQR